MALDHYVSQVHLKNFNSPALDGQMYAFRKSNLEHFRCNSKSVCRIEEGSTNAYLRSERTVEEFLRGVEPKYNSAIAKLRDGAIDPECVYVVAGFAAYVGCCTPAAMRIHSERLRAELAATATVLDKQGLIPRAPPSLEHRFERLVILRTFVKKTEKTPKQELQLARERAKEIL
jgi:hypothetical protein